MMESARRCGHSPRARRILRRSGAMSRRARRLAIAGLSILGFVDALYMLAYEERLIDSLVCPFFGEGCNIVGRSAHARHFGVPNAAVGALGYAALATLALWSGDQPPARRPWPALAVGAIATSAAAASAFLTWEQGAKVRAWCFWCLTSAALNAAILPLALGDAVPAWRSLRRRGPARAAPG
jgi:uncharacterized membrane protein